MKFKVGIFIHFSGVFFIKMQKLSLLPPITAGKEGSLPHTMLVKDTEKSGNNKIFSV